MELTLAIILFIAAIAMVFAGIEVFKLTKTNVALTDIIGDKSTEIHELKDVIDDIKDQLKEARKNDNRDAKGRFTKGG